MNLVFSHPGYDLGFASSVAEAQRAVRADTDGLKVAQLLGEVGVLGDLDRHSPQGRPFGHIDGAPRRQAWDGKEHKLTYDAGRVELAHHDASAFAHQLEGLPLASFDLLQARPVDCNGALVGD